MRVIVAVIARAARRMQAHVGNHAARNELARNEVAHQVETLLRVQFGGKRNIKLTANLRVLALLGGLDRIPEL